MDIVDYFDRYFEIVPADNADLREAAFRLRYNVYANELRLPGFEAWRYPDRMESDPYDPRATQRLLRHRSTMAWAGVVRLVHAASDSPAKPFPVEVAAGAALNRARMDGIPRQRIGEISRLTIPQQFRKRAADATLPYFFENNTEKSEYGRRSKLPLIFLGLMAATIQMTTELGVTHWLAAMDVRLSRLLARLGLQLSPIGPEIEMFGIRRPYFGSVAEVLENARTHEPAVWQLLDVFSSRAALETAPPAHGPDVSQDP